MENDSGDDSTLWGATNEKIYIDVMVDLINKGGMKDGQFSSKEWTNMLEALNNKSKRNYNMKQIKQKFNRLRSKHREFSELLQQTGFGWDVETNTVNATDEMWQNYIRVHPKANQFRKKGCEHYKLLGIIFNKSTATRVFRHASTSDSPNTNDGMELEAESAHVSISHDDPLSTLDKLTSNLRKSTASSSLERRSKKETTSQQISDAIQAWTETAKAKIEVAKAKVEKYKSFYTVDDNSIGNAKDCSIATCVSLLEAIDGVDNATYLKAVEKLKEKCIGAIDGTHISKYVAAEKQGTANDSRVFLDVITRSENKFPLPKEGEYYVVDSGIPCTVGFLSPFRGERYHLQEYHGRGRQPRGPKELFNYRHSSLRNVIERYFGVLKAWFRILKMMLPYKQSRQPLVVIACCTLHNSIRKWAQNDVMFRQWEEEEQKIEDEETSTSGSNNSIDLPDEAATTMAAYRNKLSQVMWHDYVSHM
ncbi:uncharacterized protein LOC125422919 [Ziziphus jujuba]|uniref:Uncharacterized protein LOC125422919 n=1 Tax=Ziziphus jujuba TaxID=326968 RepID=A0ABM4AEA3_ZIZJJ|nr:uncharacterized protein LOC125422919 [Ziziphus jujuba]